MTVRIVERRDIDWLATATPAEVDRALAAGEHDELSGTRVGLGRMPAPRSNRACSDSAPGRATTWRPVPARA